jgi:hypothetical protein
MADQRESMGGLQLIQAIAADWPQRVTWSFAPTLDEWEWRPLTSWVRRGLEYVRFLRPYYDDLPKYRNRARERTSRALVALFKNPVMNRPWPRRLVADALSKVDQAIPPPAALEAAFRECRADVVILASATNPGGPQLDHVKAAMAIGARSIISVWSWDHLSGKTWLRLMPNRILVWNNVQRDEVIQLHGLPAERVTVTGAQCYDQWFGRQPSATREAFFAVHGLDPSQDLLLYVCSVLARPAPEEVPFVREWIQQVRACSDPRLRDANILVRPHPERLHEWEQVDLSGLGRVAVAGRNPVDRESRDEYFDSLYFSRLVMGLLTSAFLEAAVVGRPVFTVMKPEFRLFQMDALHFRYLITLGGGLLHTSDDWAEHITQLGRALDDEAGEQERLRRFVEAFVRPGGFERAATPDFADAVECVLAEAPQTFDRATLVPGRLPAAARLLRRAIAMRGLRTVLLSRYDLAYEATLQRRRDEEQVLLEARLRDRAERESEIARLEEEKRRQRAAAQKRKSKEHRLRWSRKRRQQAMAAVRSRLRRVLG